MPAPCDVPCPSLASGSASGLMNRKMRESANLCVIIRNNH
ncbi:hypothetical protein V1289_003308 [Bradyrhizobium sp. AZCC 2289]